MELQIRRLQHIGIPVTDLEKSEVFYHRLGFKNAMSASFDHQTDKGNVIMMELNGIIIELYQMPEAVLTEIRSRKDGHIDHIAFDVEDIDHTFALLKENEFPILEEAPVFLPFWETGCRYFNIIGPDGERLEFNQIL